MPLELSGSIVVSGSMTVSGSIAYTGSLQSTGETITNISGSLFGTSSWAVSASWAPGGASITQVVSSSGTSIYTTSPSTSNFSTTEGIFLGNGAGLSATSADNAVFLGYSAGSGATSAYESVFIGSTAGSAAASANSSIFLGTNTGFAATNAYRSVFIGDSAGQGSANSNTSIFIGYQAGELAETANSSNFIGYRAGHTAVEAAISNFIGSEAGSGAASASYSNFIGYKAGASSNVSPGSNNIIIGTNITLENNQRDAINIGGIIFATGSHSNPSGDPFSGSMSQAKVGINQSLPAYTLDVSGSGNYAAGLTVSGSGIITTGVSVKRTIDSYGGFEVYNVGNSPVITLGKYNESQQLQIEPSGSSANNKNAVTFITFGTGIAFIPSSGKAVEVTGSFVVTGSFIVPSEVDANPATGSMYVEPAANKLWVYTGNSVTGWVTASLGF